MRIRQIVRGPVSLLAGALLMACAAQKPAPTQVVWQKTDGSVASRDELEAARDACAVETRQKGGDDSGRFGHVKWAVEMLDCMKAKGYERIEKPAS